MTTPDKVVIALAYAALIATLIFDARKRRGPR